MGAGDALPRDVLREQNGKPEKLSIVGKTTIKKSHTPGKLRNLFSASNKVKDEVRKKF